MVDKAKDEKPGKDKATEESSPQEDVEKETETEVGEESEETKESTESETEEKESSSEEDDKASSEEEDSQAKEETIPKSRFDEVIAERNRLRKELEDKNPKESKKKTIDDLSIDELRNLKKHYQGKGDTDAVELIDEKIIEKKAEEVHQRNQDRIDFARQMKESWDEVCVDYPELKNPNSEHYKKTLELVNKDNRFNRYPEGHAVAARLIAEQTLRGKAKLAKAESSSLKKKVAKSTVREGLESGSNRAGSSPGGTGKLDKLRKAAEDSGNPYGPEWRTYLAEIDKVKAASGKKKE